MIRSIIISSFVSSLFFTWLIGSYSNNIYGEETRNYMFGCTYYQPLYNCDPINDDFDSHAIIGDYIKIGSATRDPFFVDSKYDKALQINANALESITVKNVDVFHNDKFSVYLAVRPDNTENMFGNLISYTNGNYGPRAGWEIDSVSFTGEPSKKAIRFVVFNTDGKGITPSDVIVPANKFVDIVGTFDGKTIKIYLDGNLYDETSFVGNYTSYPSSVVPLKFGGGAYCSCNTITAVFDEIRYYNYVLTDDKIKKLNSENDILGNGLVGYWKFDGDLTDSSGLGNHAFYNTIIASMAFAPDGRLFFTEKNSGKIRIMENDQLLQKPFASFPDIYVDWEQGLLGLTLDDKYDQNHFVYIYYNYKEESTGKIYARVVRLTDVNNTATDSLVILDQIPATKSFHTGGALAFNGVDDMLYITVGDGILGNQSQDLSSLRGKVLRINRDGSIPSDNPFPNSSIYTYGHRNMYGLAFDNHGNGIITENLGTVYDEINFMKKGGNYGWPTLQPPDVPAELSNNTSLKPLRSYWRTIAPTQAVYYDKDKFPELKGTFLFGTVQGQIYSIKVDTSNEKLLEELEIRLKFYPLQQVIGIAKSPTGDIYFGASDIYKLNSVMDSSKVVTMYPVQINTTNIQVSVLNYDGSKLVVNLNDGQGPSELSLKIPNSLIGEFTSIANTFHSETTIAKDNKTEVKLPHTVYIQPLAEYSIISLDLPEDYPKEDELEFTITDTKISITRRVSELISHDTNKEVIIPKSAIACTKGECYKPSEIVIMSGDTITWTNRDSTPHTVTSGDGSNTTPNGIFDSSIITKEKTYSFTFDNAGNYPYYCILHPNMIGEVKVLNVLTIDGKKYPIEAYGPIIDIVGDEDEKSLIISIAPNEAGKLHIVLPRNIVNSINSDGTDKDFLVIVDDKVVKSIKVASTDNAVTLEIDFKEDSKIIKIIGTKMIPEFSFSLLFFGISFVLAFLVSSYKNWNWSYSLIKFNPNE